MLENLERSHEGLSAGAREVLAHLDSAERGPWNTVVGIVAELLTVRRDYAPLIDLALGDRAQRFLVRDMDELAVALIDLSGRSLRKIIGQARQRATTERSVVRGSLETFMEQLRADDKLLHVLLREGTVGSDAFKQAVDRELNFFEEELQIDLVRLAAADHARLYEPALVAKAITRLVFAAGASAMDMPPEKDPELIEQLSHMLRMIITGSRAMAKADSK